LREWLFPAVIVGGILPILVPLVLIIAGWVKKSFQTLNTGYALAQAAMSGSLISSFYKAFTGRIHPPTSSAINQLTDTSHIFHFGFLREGIFWGWPSSHTTIAFAMAVTLCMLYPKNKVLRILAIAYAIYIGLGVSISIHWFSEAVAGAVIGSVIGNVVGGYYYQRFQTRGSAE
jgi:membrane-associated phospholipid phosphatase